METSERVKLTISFDIDLKDVSKLLDVLKGYAFDLSYTSWVEGMNLIKYSTTKNDGVKSVIGY